MWRQKWNSAATFDFLLHRVRRMTGPPVASSTSTITACSSARAARLPSAPALRQKPLQDDVLVHADHRMIRPGHAHVGLIRRAFGRMRVSLLEYVYAPITAERDHQIPPWPSFRWLIRVEIHEPYIDPVAALQQRVGLRMGNPSAACSAPLQIQNRALDAVVRLDHDHALPAACRRSSPGAAAAAGGSNRRFRACPDVIAAGQNVEAWPNSSSASCGVMPNPPAEFRVGDRQWIWLARRFRAGGGHQRAPTDAKIPR